MWVLGLGILLLQLPLVAPACDQTGLAACQTEDVMKCDRPCECMVNYGKCMRDAGCEWGMYKDYLNACYGSAACAEGEVCEATASLGPAPLDANDLVAADIEIPVELPYKFGHLGTLHQPSIYANSTDNVAALVAQAFAKHPTANATAESQSQLVAKVQALLERGAEKRQLCCAGHDTAVPSAPVGEGAAAAGGAAESSPGRLIAPGLLASLAHAHADTYAAAAPFPNIALDNVFRDGPLRAALAECQAHLSRWTDSTNPHFDDQWTSSKHGHEEYESMEPAMQLLMGALKAGAFVRFLEHLTGVYGLMPDPHNNGGGLHVTRAGGHLKVHTDFNTNYQLGLERRVNVFVYLNEDWKDEFAGHLELWDANMSACHRRVLPLYNRLVVFTTTDASNHGHPDPLAAPPGRARLSVAQYYYTKGRPKHEQSSLHTTTFRARPGYAEEQDVTFYP